MRKKTSKKTTRATFGRGQGRATRGLFRRCRALCLSALPRYALVFRASVHPGSRGAATFQCVGRLERRDARTDSGHERRLHQRRQRVRSVAPHRGAGIDHSNHADPRQRALSKCHIVLELAKSLGIELLYLPTYSPNLNLIERLWKFVKKDCLYSTYYNDFAL